MRRSGLRALSTPQMRHPAPSAWDMMLDGSVFNTPYSSCLRHLYRSSVSERNWTGPDGPSAKCSVQARELALVKDGRVRRVGLTRMAPLGKILAQSNNATVWRGDIKHGHPLGELD